MSKEEKAGSAAPDEAVTDAEQENLEGQEDEAGAAANLVKHETYLRKKNLADNLAKKTKELEAKISSLMQEKLEGEGKKDELIQHLKKQVADLDTKNKQIFGNVTYNSVVSQIETEAAKLGCVDSSALVRLMDVENFVESVDPETFKANTEEIRMAIEEQKKQRAYLFSKAGPKINTQTPSNDFKKETKKPLNELSAEELEKMAKDIDKLEGKNLGWG